MLMTEASMAKLLFQESSLDPRIRDFFLFYFLFGPNHRVPLVQKYVSHILQASTHFDNSFSLLLFSYRSLCSWFRLIRVTLLNKLLHIRAKVFFTTEYTKQAAVQFGGVLSQRCVYFFRLRRTSTAQVYLLINSVRLQFPAPVYIVPYAGKNKFIYKSTGKALTTLML